MQAAHGQRVASDLGLPVGEGDGEAASSGAAPRVSVVGELGGAGAAPKKTLARKLSEAVMKRERANSLGHTYTCGFAALQPPAAARRGRRPLLLLLLLRCCCGLSLARSRADSCQQQLTRTPHHPRPPARRYDQLQVSMDHARPAGVDPAHREAHLTEEDFVKYFKMPRDAFGQLAAWKQLQIKKKLGLF
jgi:hypothetical protein